jgi:hypothetical protein
MITEVELDGRDVQHVWGDEKCIQNFSQETWREVTTLDAA